MRHQGTWMAAVAGSLGMWAATPAAAQTRTPWQMHNGTEVTEQSPLGVLPFSCSPERHGAVCEYDVAEVPGVDDAGWGDAPNPDTLAPAGASRRS